MNLIAWRARARRTLAILTTTALAGGVVVVGTGSAAVAAEPAATVTSGSAQWGVKESFRRYLLSPIADGSVTPVAPAEELADGRFSFAAQDGTVQGPTAQVDFAGGVSFAGHDAGEGPVLEVHLSDVRVVIDGDEGSLFADVTSREFIDTTTLGELVEHVDVEVGSIDLSSTPLTVEDGVASLSGAPVTLTADGAPAFGGFYEADETLDPLSFSVELAPATVAPAVTAAPQDVTVDAGQDAVLSAAATGTPEPTVQWQTRTGEDAEWQDVAGATATDLTVAAVTAAQDGTQVRAVFSNGTAPDAVTEPATLTVAAAPVEPGEPAEPEQPTGWEPHIEVFAADGVTPIGATELTDGDSVIVRGTGFDPAGNTGGRGAPIPGDLPQGTYVVLGTFAEQWQPSTEAPSSARVVGDQRWALAESVLDQVPERFQESVRNQWVDLDIDGSFTTELTVDEPESGWLEDGSFGVYTYAAGGATNADQELSVPLTVVDEPVAPEPVEWEPAIEVLAADGVTPVGDTQLTYGDTVVVRGTGFDPAGNVGGRGAPIPNTLPQGTYVVFGSFADQWRPSQDAPSANRVIGAQKWALAESVLDQVPPNFQDAIRGQWVDLAEDGSFTAELTLGGLGKAWPQDGTFGVYTYGAGGVKNPDQELSVPLNFVPQPQIEVLGADGVTPVGNAQLVEGDTVVVRGTGFDPAGNVGGRGRPIPAELPQGTYVVLGKFAEQWQPSLDAPTSARVVGDQRWALAEDVLDQVPEGFQEAIRNQWVEIAADGSFTAELTVAEPETGWPEDGAFGVYTYAAGGVKNPAQELSVPLTVVEERVPQLEVTPTENLTVGTVVTVEGTGYAPDRAISVAFTPNTVTDEEFGWPVGWLQHEVVTTDALGSFTREITVSGWFTGTGDDCSEVQCYLATFNSAQLTDAVPVDHRAERDMDVFVPVSFRAGTTEPEPQPGTPSVVALPDPVRQGEELTVSGSNLPVGTEVTATLEPSTLPAAGHLDWGVKESFRSYVGGPVAGGSVTTSEDVTAGEDGAFRFPATLMSQDDATGTALLAFAGSVAFQGHEVDGTPALDILLENLRVELTAESALLLADATSRDFVDTSTAGRAVEYDDVVIATLDRKAFATDGGAVTASGAAATLTAVGEPAFGGFYDAGVALDPVSVDVAAVQAMRTALALDAQAEPVEIGSATVAENGTVTMAWDVPTDFPLGGYAVVLRDSAGAALASDALTVLAAQVTEPEQPGEQPEPEPEPQEPRGSVVVEPDPVTRGATARIIGSDLEPGTRVGAVIDAAGAPGSLQWGIKDSFRTYIRGGIAQGSITVTAPATEAAGRYVFGDGRGNGDASDGTAHFGGTVAFAGHEIGGTSQLQLTVTDPSVVIEGGSGYLVADVVSRSLDGDGVVDYPRARLAELDLAGVTVQDGRLVGTDVPARLTAEGVPAFADFYEAGEGLDPVTFDVPVGDGTELDLGTLDVAEATVGQDGTVELTWTVPADLALGSHRVDLVTDGESVADTTVAVVAAAGDKDDDGAGTGTTAGGSGGGRLAQTGADAAALAALAAGVVLAGAVIASRRQHA